MFTIASLWIPLAIAINKTHGFEVSKLIKRIVLTLVLSSCAGGVIAMPISDADIVAVNGKQWAQPYLFRATTWNKVNEVCPDKVCSGILSTNWSGSLAMDGWIWASMAEVTSLLNVYGAALKPQLGSKYEIDSAWAPAFFADGWKDTGQGGGFLLVEGLLSDRDCAVFPPFPPFPCMVSILDRPGPGDFDEALVTGSPFPYVTIGAWFYRDATQVPAPATLTLFGLGIASLGIFRRKRAV